MLIKVLTELKEKNADQPEFIEAATNILKSLEPVIEDTLNMKIWRSLKDLLNLKELLCLKSLGLMMKVRYCEQRLPCTVL